MEKGLWRRTKSTAQRIFLATNLLWLAACNTPTPITSQEAQARALGQLLARQAAIQGIPECIDPTKISWTQNQDGDWCAIAGEDSYCGKFEDGKWTYGKQEFQEKERLAFCPGPTNLSPDP